MNRIAQLREQIDACRHGSDDLSLPALAELAAARENDRAVADELDRSQQFDRAVVSALHDVPVPGDLLERLLAQAEKHRPQVQDVVATGAPGAEKLHAPTPASASTAPPRLRRRLLVASCIATIAAALVGLGLFLPRPARNVSQDELAAAAADWYADARDPSARWQPYNAAKPHSALLLQPSRSRQIATEYGSATVYDLSSQGRFAALIVVRTRDHFAVGPLPFTTVTGATGGLAIGAWQSQGTLYVLVIDEDRLRLDDLLGRRTAA